MTIKSMLSGDESRRVEIKKIKNGIIVEYLKDGKDYGYIELFYPDFDAAISDIKKYLSKGTKGLA